MEWLTDNKIPLGDWSEAFIDFVDANFAWFFDLISDGLRFVMDGLQDFLLWCNPIVLIVAVAAFAFWLHRSWGLLVGVILSLLLVLNLGYWAELVETFALIVFATFICMAMGVPLGVAAAHRPWLYTILRPILDLMQTIPTFVYLIPTLVLFGLGLVPGLISTVIFAIPAPVRLTYLGISSVPKPLKEAAESFGATKRQLLWKVELPHAMPTIMAGLTQCIMLSLSMVVIAALVGAGGLGKPVVKALNTVNIANGVEAGISIVVLAILLDRVCKQRGASSGEKGS
jgi:glycine betaine/proline transport system permease protein